jgi:hypothetical protein
MKQPYFSSRKNLSWDVGEFEFGVDICLGTLHLNVDRQTEGKYDNIKLYSFQAGS